MVSVGAPNSSKAVTTFSTNLWKTRYPLTNTQKNVALESIGYESSGQQGRVEYAISLDMAKGLST